MGAEQEISVFEAAVRYDLLGLRGTRSPGPAHYLVIDLDTCAFAHLASDAKGEVLTLRSDRVGQLGFWELCAPGIQGLVGDATPEELRRELLEQASQCASALKRYLVSERAIDGRLVRLGGVELSCSQFEAAIQPALQAVSVLADHIQAQVDDAILDECAIIVVGDSQRLPFASHALRERLSADPLLPDERFRNDGYADSPQDVVRLGRLYALEKPASRHVCELMLFERQECQAASVLGMDTEQITQDAWRSEYVGPVYLSAGDALRVRVDGKLQELPIPYTFAPLQNDAVEIAWELRDGAAALLVRRCDLPTRVYTIELAW